MSKSWLKAADTITNLSEPQFPYIQMELLKSPLQSGCDDQQMSENHPAHCKATAVTQSDVARIARRVFLKMKWEFSQKPLDHIPQRMIFL